MKTKRSDLVMDLARGVQTVRRALIGLTDEARDDIELIELSRAREALDSIDREADDNGLPGLWAVLHRPEK
jgi:hypothetical protein